MVKAGYQEREIQCYEKGAFHSHQDVTVLEGFPGIGEVKKADVKTQDDQYNKGADSL
jgi:hypothetical protein